NMRGIEISIVADSQDGYYTGWFQKWIEPTRFVGRNLPDVEAHALSTIQIDGEDLGILWPPGDFQAARMDPFQRLSRFRSEVLDFSAGIPDEFDHQIAFTEATHHSGGTGRSLRADIVLVEQSDSHPATLHKIV